MILVAAALFAAADGGGLVARAGGMAATTRDRQVVAIATAHLRYVDPLPANTGEVVRAFDKVLIPELNTGQMLSIIRGKYLVDAIGYNKMEALPIFAEELEGAILEALS